MGDEYRPNVFVYPDVDGPLYEHLAQVDNASGWIRDALIAFAATFGKWVSDGPPKQYKGTVSPELADFINRIGLRRRHHLIRAALWFYFGQQSVEQKQVDTRDLARAIVQEMRAQGMALETSAPDEELAQEVEEQFLGQFL